jgi:hypothetical protein
MKLVSVFIGELLSLVLKTILLFALGLFLYWLFTQGRSFVAMSKNRHFEMTHSNQNAMNEVSALDQAPPAAQ